MENRPNVLLAEDDGNMAMTLADAILLDAMLPGCDGFTICGDLRARGGATPIVMVTGRTLTSDKIRALRAGADDYVTKPFDVAELPARVFALPRRSRGMATTELLRYLASRKNLTIGRQELLREVWGYQSIAFSFRPTHLLVGGIGVSKFSRMESLLCMRSSTPRDRPCTCVVAHCRLAF